MQDLKDTVDKIEKLLDEKNAVREEALKRSRVIIKKSSEIIQSIHNDIESDELILKLFNEAKELKSMLKNHQDLYYSGFVENAFMELSEAVIFNCIVKNKSIPTVEELGVTSASYLLGLGDVIGEVRRMVLNLLRKGEIEKSSEYLDIMEDLYLLIMRFNYPNAIVGIRRKQDIARGLIEKTRGEVTFAIRGKKLEDKMDILEKKLS